jgi:hypothetical protein
MIPTTQQIKDQNVANFESNINQTSPLNDKAFIRVLSAVEAILFKSLYNFGVDRIKQVLATTATNQGLDDIGNDYGVVRKTAVSTVLTATLPGTNGTIIPTTIDFVGDANGIRYAVDASVTTGVPTSGLAELTLTAKTAGTIGNLQAGDTLSIGTQIPGAETVATVAVIAGQTDAILTTGTEAEKDDAYRIRVLDVIRAPGGGGNAADYRNWSQETAGVARAYPYGGKPFDVATTSFPGDRTVYVQADESIDPDGIAPASLLDDVRDTITTDPETGLARQPLGMIDSTLFIESIVRTSFFVQITNLEVSTDFETQAKADIETALEIYFDSLVPFVEGIDVVRERNDLITELTISEVIQDVLSTYGGSAESIAFGLSVGSFITFYSLDPGELAKLGSPNGIVYV